MDRRDRSLPLPQHDRGRRVDPDVELLADPCDTLGADPVEPGEQLPASVIVLGVKRSSGPPRKRAKAGAGMYARRAWPDGTACIGTRVPVQSRACTAFEVSTWSM